MSKLEENDVTAALYLELKNKEPKLVEKLDKLYLELESVRYVHYESEKKRRWAIAGIFQKIDDIDPARSRWRLVEKYNCLKPKR